jgi:hypothetical protein
MLSLDNFQKITLEDKSIFQNLYSKYPPVHSDDLFTTMISWMEYSNYHFAVVGDNIVLLTLLDNKVRLRPPYGKKNKGLLKQVLTLAIKEGSDEPFGVINSNMKDWIGNEFPKLNFLRHRNYFDYVYKSSELASLKGSKYSKIRNRLNKFKKNYEYIVEKISEENIDETNQFLKRWCLWRDCDSDIVLTHEKKAIMFSMAHFFDLGLSGILIRINGNIESLAVYEGMNSDTAVVHYEKGSPYFDGVYKAINMETAKILQNDFTFINREEDMGISGLRKAKMSYHPHHMVEVFHVKKKDIIF